MANNIHVGDFGITFKFTVLDQDDSILDISTASGMLLNFEKPDTSQIYKDGSWLTDGTDGQIVYVTESGLFDQSGYWKVNAVVSSETYRHTTNIVRFKVEEDL
jgi:ABC-type Mn2+/Zn2+ transport system ATPase subunit